MPDTSVQTALWLMGFMLLFCAPVLMVGLIWIFMLDYSDWNRSVWDDDGPHRWWWWTSVNPYNGRD